METLSPGPQVREASTSMKKIKKHTRFALKTANRRLSAEFRPGEPWKGYPNIDPETDPYMTPGSVINSLSINTVRDTDHLRDRNNGTVLVDIY